MVGETPAAADGCLAGPTYGASLSATMIVVEGW